MEETDHQGDQKVKRELADIPGTRDTKALSVPGGPQEEGAIEAIWEGLVSLE